MRHSVRWRCSIRSHGERISSSSKEASGVGGCRLHSLYVIHKTLNLGPLVHRESLANTVYFLCVRVLVQRIPLRQELLHHIASLWNETQYTPFLQTIFQRWFECEASVAPQWGEGPQAMVYVPLRLHATNDALAHNDDWLALAHVPQKSHGDYRTDNLFFTEDASGVAMIDFQLIRRGGPIAVLQDVAYLLVISTCTRPNSLIVAAART